VKQESVLDFQRIAVGMDLPIPAGQDSMTSRYPAYSCRSRKISFSIICYFGATAKKQECEPECFTQLKIYGFNGVFK
jgi:hypothetical protein